MKKKKEGKKRELEEQKRREKCFREAGRQEKMRSRKVGILPGYQEVYKGESSSEGTHECTCLCAERYLWHSLGHM